MIRNMTTTDNFPSHDGTSNDMTGIRVMLLLANTLDCNALERLFSEQQQVSVVEATTDIESGMTRCRRLMPHVLIIDPKECPDIAEYARETTQERYLNSIILLDERLYDGRLASILDFPQVSYMTRQSGFEALLSATIKAALQGERVFDPLFANRLSSTSRGVRLELAQDRPTVAALSLREIGVLKMLAQGYSVRDCAKQLNLAESAVDNHKSRLMRKLEVHKAAELTQIAIRDGIIVV